MSNLKYIPTWKIKQILSENYTRGTSGIDYEPIKQELENILYERENNYESSNEYRDLLNKYNQE